MRNATSSQGAYRQNQRLAVIGFIAMASASIAIQQARIVPLEVPSHDENLRHLGVAATQTLSGARISEFDSSVMMFTRWKPAFLRGTAWNTR